jgi:dihydroneopterin aldolase
MGLIRVRDLPVEVRIGTLPEEHISPQTVRLDLEVRTDMSRAAAGDHLDETVNYIDLVAATRDALTASSAYLVETLVARALDALIGVPGVTWARVRVRKYHLPGMGEVGHVEIEEEREAR